MTAETLRIRSYNVRFGDAILITVPDRGENGQVTRRHILIDVGNVLSGGGGDDAVFVPILEDVLAETEGKPLDLYVMTHEHMDHVQGLLAGFRHGVHIQARHVWITASAEPDYYDRHPEARKKFQFALRAYLGLERQLAAAPKRVNDRLFARMLNNNHRKTADCIAHIREKICKPEDIHYVHREYDVQNAHSFNEAKFEIWAPEEDTAIYYGRFRPLALGLDNVNDATEERKQLPRPVAPTGVDVGAFDRLLERRASGAYDNLMAIDKARNNTSVVFSLEWRGWRLLFAGDAETRSWKTMFKHKVIKPVHFLKVSHHGSHNGTPSGEILEALLPAAADDGRERHALLSTCDDTYSGVPHSPTTATLAGRCRILDTRSIADGASLDLGLKG